MKYENICKGSFIARPNRFIAEAAVGGEIVRAHVKNTGRCRELLQPGVEVFLEDHSQKMGKRKLRYSLIAVRKGDMLVNIDSQAPNRVCEEALRTGRLVLPFMRELKAIEREKTFMGSRFDFRLQGRDGRNGWLEVKGVTLEENGIARFPDAPTERGVRHVLELIEAVKQGDKGAILFVIQMEGIRCFEPNDRTHKAFGDALRTAAKSGVEILAYQCRVDEDQMVLSARVPVRL